MLYVPLNLTKEQLMDRANCFEMFRKSYRKNEAMEENKEILKEKYAKGKALGNAVNAARARINELKNQVRKKNYFRISFNYCFLCVLSIYKYYLPNRRLRILERNEL
jgi:hypothetical protein